MQNDMILRKTPHLSKKKVRDMNRRDRMKARNGGIRPGIPQKNDKTRKTKKNKKEVAIGRIDWQTAKPI